MKHFPYFAAIPPTIVMTLLAACSASPRQQCYAENYCATADGDCVVAWTILADMLSKTYSDGGSSSSSPYYYSESESNDYFSNATLFSPGGWAGSRYMEGTINDGSDIDIFYVGYTYGPTASVDVRFSKTGAAVCSVYLRSSISNSATSAPDGTFTLQGTLGPSTMTVNVPINHYIYIICSGSAGNTYSIFETWPEASSNDYGSTGSFSGPGLMTLLCAGSRQACEAECNSKHPL